MDRERSAQRIDRDIETLAGPDYTVSDEAIRRYAYTDAYRRTLDYFVRELDTYVLGKAVASTAALNHFFAPARYVGFLQ